MLLTAPNEHTATEEVSSLEVQDSDGMRAVFLKGTLIYTVDLEDRTYCRWAAAQLYLTHDVSQSEIAVAWGATRRIVNGWISTFREEGLKGLEDKKQGRPVKATRQRKNRVFQLRANRLEIPEIARQTKLSQRTVKRILFTEAESSQEMLPGLEESSQENEQQEAEASEDIGKNAQPSDPLDRTQDRAAAAAGLIQEAEPVFAESEHVEGAGAFLAIAALGRTGFFRAVQRIYGSFGAAFYGVRSIFMTLFVISVLRIRNPERLNRDPRMKVGRIIGLDRGPSVKTLRSKLKVLAARRQAANLMNLLAKERLQGTGQPAGVLFVDGHVQCYYGKSKVGKVFSSTKSRVVRGNTDYWVNLGDGTPLLCIPTPFNDRMSKVLPVIVRKAQKLCHGKRLTLVFDRGGADAASYERLLQLGCDFIAYHKNPQPVDSSVFSAAPTVINNRQYDYAPYERDIELPVYIGKGKGRRRKTDRTVPVREIVVRRKDEGNTHVITSRRDQEAVTICSTLFSRWTQENFFKYMIANYEFDHIYTYRTENVPADVDHPNPEYTQLEKQQKKIRQRIAAILGKDLDRIADNRLDELADMHKGSKGEELQKLSETLKEVRKALKKTPKRESAAHYRMLEPESRMIGNTVKSTAWHIEGLLAELVRDTWNGVNGNERGIVEGFLQTTGSIKQKNGVLNITLQQQATPEQTRVLKHVCDELTVMCVKYPGSQLRMVFDVADK